jgi:hypothetical protein
VLERVCESLLILALISSGLSTLLLLGLYLGAVNFSSFGFNAKATLHIIQNISTKFYQAKHYTEEYKHTGYSDEDPSLPTGNIVRRGSLVIMLGHHGHPSRFAARCNTIYIIITRSSQKQSLVQGRELGKHGILHNAMLCYAMLCVESSKANLSSASLSLNVGRVAVLENIRL